MDNRRITAGAGAVVVIPASLAKDADITGGANSFVVVYADAGTPPQSREALTAAIGQALAHRTQRSLTRPA
jgi:antitoxin component of MazEF toxin-antitoxin module